VTVPATFVLAPPAWLTAPAFAPGRSGREHDDLASAAEMPARSQCTPGIDPHEDDGDPPSAQVQVEDLVHDLLWSTLSSVNRSVAMPVQLSVSSRTVAIV
jgi:hypothetical protein